MSSTLIINTLQLQNTSRIEGTTGSAAAIISITQKQLNTRGSLAGTVGMKCYALTRSVPRDVAPNTDSLHQSSRRRCIRVSCFSVACAPSSAGAPPHLIAVANSRTLSVFLMYRRRARPRIAEMCRLRCTSEPHRGPMLKQTAKIFFFWSTKIEVCAILGFSV